MQAQWWSTGFKISFIVFILLNFGLYKISNFNCMIEDNVKDWKSSLQLFESSNGSLSLLIKIFPLKWHFRE